jgi:predicted dehydrogenase
MGKQHAWHANSDPASEITLYVDAIQERAQQLADRYGGTATTECCRALDDPDVQGVILTVPDLLHAPLALQALGAGKHVMVEKPISLTLEDADAMITAAERGGCMLFVAHALRFRPALRRIKRLIEKETFGTPIFARYHHEHFPDLRDRPWLVTEEEGGVFISGAVHHADLMRWWFGEVKAVTGHAMEVRPEYKAVGQYDHTLIVYDFESGAMGESTYSYSSHHANLHPSVEASATFTEGDLLLLTDGTLHIYQPAQTALLDQQGTLTLRPLPGTGIGFEVPHFTECIRMQQRPAITAQDARRALELVLAARQSAHEGRKLRVLAVSAA